MHRDVVVIGGSAGSISVLRTLVSSLAEDISAAIFIIVHSPPRTGNQLTQMLQKYARIPVREASDGAALEHGVIYVAQPDRHVLIADGHMHSTRGPKEGLHRPSINVTFRSAAQALGPRVIGVLLSGMLDDGASGLWEISRRGGVAIIQDPDDALFPSMPLNALRDAAVHYRLRANEIAPLLKPLVDGLEMPQRWANRDSDSPAEQFSGLTC
ncbi:MAG: chemotaxis protein CheB, partial [Acidobacteriaceae bacterium]|nr:chemotaxis protein CheB [Acidobacteriaceae bacterium]